MSGRQSLRRRFTRVARVVGVSFAVFLSLCAWASEPGSEELKRGEDYAYGRGVPQDDVKAVQLFRVAAEKGNPEAQYKLGVMLENGYGISTSYRAAIDWYLKAAVQGHSGAESNIGSLYERGLGVAADPAKAARWYRRAAEHGDGHGSYNLGQAYLDGAGVPQDDALALEYFRAAERLGIKEASAKVDEIERKKLHAGVEDCGSVPAEFRGKEYGEALYSVLRPCRRPLSTNEQLFVAGMSEYLVDHCDLPADPDARAMLRRFRMSSALVAAIGGDYSNPDLIEGRVGMYQAQMAYAGGTSAAESVGCSAGGRQLADRIVAYVARSQAGVPGKAGFVDGCSEHYISTYSREQCQCVADVGSAVLPNIHQMRFNSSTIKEIIEKNPFLGLQLGVQCGIGDY